MMSVANLSAAITRSFLCFLFAAITSSVAAAASMDDLDPKQICPVNGGVLSKYVLARSLDKIYSISLDILDWNDKGIDYDEYAQALAIYRCAHPQSEHDKNKCYGPTPKYDSAGIAPLTADADAQRLATADVTRRLDEAQTNAGIANDFDLKLQKVTLHFHRVHPQASNIDAAKQSLLALAKQYSHTTITAEVFTLDPKYFDISCANNVSPGSGPGNNNPGQNNPNPGVVSGSTLPPNLFDNVRLRGKPEDLNIGRDLDAFSGVSSATIAIVNDNIAQKNTFDAHVVLGYALPTQQLGAGVLDSIPFIQYDRDYVDGSKAPPNSSNVNNIATGVMESLTFPIVDDVAANLVFQPEYIWSLRSRAQIAKLHVAFQPEPLWPYFVPTPIGIPGFLATAYARGVLNIGDVTHSTTDPTLALTNTFTQAGVQMGIAIGDNDPNSIFNGFSIPIDYTNLYGFVGQYRSISLFSAAINYTFPKTKYVTVGLSYVDGRNLDTFEKQQVYKATLGVKY